MNFLQQMGALIIVIMFICVLCGLYFVKIADLLEEHTSLSIEDSLAIAALALVTTFGILLFLIGTFI